MKSIKVTYKGLRFMAFGFLLLPVLLFLLFFTRPYIGFPTAAVLVGVYFLSVREEMCAGREFEITPIRLVIFLAICALWCYLGGQGGLFYQAADWNERNAIFRDLIVYQWPVYYPETDTMLTYYIGHWLPAAGLGRIIYLLTQDIELAFKIGNVLLGLWTLCGVLLTLLLHICTISPRKWSGQWLTLLMFLGFSGMDIIGCCLMHWDIEDIVRIQHIEWWIDRYQFSSNTTCLFWVFNQAVPSWVATLCFANEKNNRNYAFIVGCILLSASLPSVGLAVLMIGRVFIEVVKAGKERSIGRYIRKTFSPSNVLVVICWVPIVGLYLMSNSALEKTVDNAMVQTVSHVAEHMKNFSALLLILAAGVLILHAVFKIIFKRRMGTPFLLGVFGLLVLSVVVIYTFHDVGKAYFAFLALECGIYWLLIADDYHREPMYYLIAAVFILCPCIKVGIGADFCMRASLPALTLLMSMCTKKLCNYLECRQRQVMNSVSCLLLAGCLMIGVVTPAVEIYRGVTNVVSRGKLVQTADSVYTLNQYHTSGGIYGNFVSENYRDALFFKYIARKK